MIFTKYQVYFDRSTRFLHKASCCNLRYCFDLLSTFSNTYKHPETPANNNTHKVCTRGKITTCRCVLCSTFYLEFACYFGVVQQSDLAVTICLDNPFTSWASHVEISRENTQNIWILSKFMSEQSSSLKSCKRWALLRHRLLVYFRTHPPLLGSDSGISINSVTAV